MKPARALALLLFTSLLAAPATSASETHPAPAAATLEPTTALTCGDLSYECALVLNTACQPFVIALGDCPIVLGLADATASSHACDDLSAKLARTLCLLVFGGVVDCDIFVEPWRSLCLGHVPGVSGDICDNFGSEPTHTLCEALLGGVDLPCDIFAEPWATLCRIVKNAAELPCDIFAEPWATLCRLVKP